MLPMMEQQRDTMPEGDDKLAIKYIIQELRKVK